MTVLQWLRVDETAMQGGFLQYLWPLLRARPALLGGGAPPPRSVLVNPFDGTPDPYATALRRASRRAAQPATSLAGVTFSSAMKQAAYGSLRALVERQQLLIPSSATELRQELLTLRVGLSRSGSETFDAESGGFDDLPDALVLALRPYRRRDGQWRTQLGDLAGTGVPWPAAWSGAETVVTGAGLRLLETPVWASLVGHVGRDLTVPDGLHEHDPTAERARQEEEARRERVWALVNERQEVAHGD